jgi:hypothetical protein
MKIFQSQHNIQKSDIIANAIYRYSIGTPLPSGTAYIKYINTKCIPPTFYDKSFSINLFKYNIKQYDNKTIRCIVMVNGMDCVSV